MLFDPPYSSSSDESDGGLGIELLRHEVFERILDRARNDFLKCLPRRHKFWSRVEGICGHLVKPLPNGTMSRNFSRKLAKHNSNKEKRRSTRFGCSQQLPTIWEDEIITAEQMGVNQEGTAQMASTKEEASLTDDKLESETVEGVKDQSSATTGEPHSEETKPLQNQALQQNSDTDYRVAEVSKGTAGALAMEDTVSAGKEETTAVVAKSAASQYVFRSPPYIRYPDEGTERAAWAHAIWKNFRDIRTGATRF